MLSKRESTATDASREARLAMGLWLKSLREEQDMSQRDLAAALELDYYTFISQLENGRGRIPPARYRDSAGALKVDVRGFVMTLLSYHEPLTYEILFDEPA